MEAAPDSPGTLLCFSQAPSSALTERQRLHHLGKKHSHPPARPRCRTAYITAASINAGRNAAPSATGSVAGDIPKPSDGFSSSAEIAPGKVISFETGRVARQAAGSVIVKQGDTVVFCTACAESSSQPGMDFLPLRVDYAERFSSTGRTSGSYMKREGRPSEHEILSSRLIDRPLRPMFADGYFNEVQVLASVLSYDEKHTGDALAICGCAAALHISSIPLSKAVAGVRIARIDEEFAVNPTVQEMERSKTNLVVAGTRDAVLMIEGSCDFLTEEQVLEAVQVAQVAIAKLCDAMDDLREKAGKEKAAVEVVKLPGNLLARMNKLATGLDAAISVIEKKPREAAMQAVKNVVFAELAPSKAERARDSVEAENAEAVLRTAYKKFVSNHIRSQVFGDGKRPDGRDTKTVRPITIDQGYLPCTHGSSLFTRGETQALAVVTLGGDNMAQRFETLRGEDAARFYLQYSFPPSSVGEVGRIGAPGRREIGHGKLAERALAAVLPSKEEFPYVVRVESTITESCGSSSMASVCGGCLALMDAGVPITEPVAGIAMGLLLEESSERFAILTDILGLGLSPFLLCPKICSSSCFLGLSDSNSFPLFFVPVRLIEDALGDMDFKVAGTATGITALQMDIKVEGITIDIMRDALLQAKTGRLHILSEMSKAQAKPNRTLPVSVPKMQVMKIPVKRIGDMIGQGGRNIKALIERCGGENKISITVEDDGVVSFASSDERAISQAMEIVKEMIVTVDVGTRFDATVTKILPFGAYVSIGNGKEGWLHISELERKRTVNVEDVFKVGDKCTVQVIEVGRNGQFRVSRKACLPPDASVVTPGIVRSASETESEEQKGYVAGPRASDGA
jgi:polyribonucleotide nucleotidyltransferase